MNNKTETNLNLLELHVDDWSAEISNLCSQRSDWETFLLSAPCWHQYPTSWSKAAKLLLFLSLEHQDSLHVLAAHVWPKYGWSINNWILKTNDRSFIRDLSFTGLTRARRSKAWYSIHWTIGLRHQPANKVPSIYCESSSVEWSMSFFSLHFQLAFKL